MAAAVTRTPQDYFTRRWVCGVVRSGYHNGAGCGPDDPHSGWGCGYRWECSLTDAQARRAGFDMTEVDG